MRGEADLTRVLYLAGFGRSGSTILGNVLGQVDGWFHGGEIRNLWNDGWIDNRRCGCGRPFSECEVWSVVSQRLVAEYPSLDPAGVVEARDRTARTRQLPMWLFAPTRSRLRDQAGQLLQLLSTTYRAIAEVTGASTVVDSTMSPAYGMLLASTPGIELSVLHLTRDPRAVAYSWWRESMQDGEDAVAMRRYNVGASTVKWVVENLASERLGPTGRGAKLSVRYEDFVTDPANVVADAVSRIDSTATPPPWYGNAVDIEPTHAVWGNPSRFATGRVEIRSDQRWRTELGAKQRAMVDLLTTGTRRRYGY